MNQNREDWRLRFDRKDEIKGSRRNISGSSLMIEPSFLPSAPENPKPAERATGFGVRRLVAALKALTGQRTPYQYRRFRASIIYGRVT